MFKIGKSQKWSWRGWQALDLQAGSGLDSIEVKGLESILLEDPENRTAQILLAGYWRVRTLNTSNRARKETYAKHFLRHLSWLIANDPANPDLSDAYFSKSHPGFAEIEALWRTTIRTNPNNAQVLVNGAHFFQNYRVALAEKLWKRVNTLEPGNEEWLRKLSYLYRLQARDRRAAKDQGKAKKSIHHFKLALEAHEKNPGEYFSWWLLPDTSDFLELAKKFKLVEEERFFENYLCSIQKKTQRRDP